MSSVTDVAWLGEAASLVSRIAASGGKDIPADEALQLGKQLVAQAVDLIDGHAKAKAEAAGKAAADAVTTEDAAEAAQRRP